MRIKTGLRKMFRAFGIQYKSDFFLLMYFWKKFPSTFKTLLRSKSQIRQDVFVINQIGLDRVKKGGYFVEVGAADGIRHSNSLLLEKEYKWHGILLEPDSRWYPDLENNRSAVVDRRCAWSNSETEVHFIAAPDALFSTLEQCAWRDNHAEKRINGEKRKVKTVTLNDLLTQYQAPRNIQYISIDTEGSELEVLKGLDLDYWNVEILTIEHNFTERRNEVMDHMCRNGYRRVPTRLSNFDDWYIKLNEI